MGKSLVIKGADFSQNAIIETPSFYWLWTFGSDYPTQSAQADTEGGVYYYATSMPQGTINVLKNVSSIANITPMVAVVEMNTVNMTYTIISEHTFLQDSDDPSLYKLSNPVTARANQYFFFKGFYYNNVQDAFINVYAINSQNELIYVPSAHVVWAFDFGYYGT